MMNKYSTTALLFTLLLSGCATTYKLENTGTDFENSLAERQDNGEGIYSIGLKDGRTIQSKNISVYYSKDRNIHKFGSSIFLYDGNINFTGNMHQSDILVDQVQYAKIIKKPELGNIVADKAKESVMAVLTGAAIIVILPFCLLTTPSICKT